MNLTQKDTTLNCSVFSVVNSNSQTCKWIPNGLFTYITLSLIHVVPFQQPTICSWKHFMHILILAQSFIWHPCFWPCLESAWVKSTLYGFLTKDCLFNVTYLKFMYWKTISVHWRGCFCSRQCKLRIVYQTRIVKIFYQKSIIFIISYCIPYFTFFIFWRLKVQN